MSKYLNLKRKLFFLAIITAVLVVPIFAHGAGTDWSETNTYCYTKNFEEYDGSHIDRTMSSVCFSSMGSCSAALSKEKSVIQWSWLGTFWKPKNQTIFSEFCVNTLKEEDSKTTTATVSLYAGDPCVFSIDLDLIGCAKVVLAWGMSLILWLLTWVLWSAGQLFNLSIQLSISNFSSLANSDAINTIWGLGRDLANICFIFVLMYIAITTIIQKTGSNTRELVVQLIITALLINFSIIIPKVIIDVGNSLAVVFYNQMGEPGVKGAPDIATILVKGVGPEQFLASKSTPGTTPDIEPTIDAVAIGQSSWSTILLKGLSGGAIFLILSYALFIASFMFLARTVVLIFLIATSSLAFFSKIIPSKNLNYWETWFNTLIKEVMFAPFFLFLFYLVLLLADTNPFSGTTDDSTVVAFIWPLILCGLAIGTTIIAKKASTWSSKVVSAVGKYGGSAIARNTVGRAANKIANSEGMKSLATRIPRTGRVAQAVLSTASNAKFGGKSYETAQKARVDSMKNITAGMSTEQKAKYMSNLSPSNQKTFYANLSEEDRTKIEGAASGMAEDGAQKAGTKARDAHLRNNPNDTAGAAKKEQEAKEKYTASKTDFITSQRKNLTGEDKIKTYAQRIKGVKTGADKLKLLNELTGNEKELKAVVKELDENSLAKIRTDGAFATANQVIKNAVNDKVSGYDAEASEKFDKAEKKEFENKAKADKKDKINDLMYRLGTAPAPAGWVPTATSVDIIKSLDKQSLSFLDKKTVKAISSNSALLQAIGSEMGMAGIIKFLNHPDLTDTEAEAAGNKLKSYPGSEPKLLNIKTQLTAAVNGTTFLGDLINKRG